MKHFRIFSVVLFSFAAFQANAQQTLGFFKNNVYNLNYNPANEVKVRSHLGIGISNLNLQIGTNITTYNRLISLDKEGNKVIHLDGLRATKNSYREFTCDLGLEVLGFGFHAGKNLYLTFSSRLRLDNAVFVPGDFLNLAVKGNISHIGEEMKILPLVSVLTYLDNSIGFQYKINEKITIGARGKLLVGMLGANTKESHFTLMTDSEWNLHLKGSALVNLYAPARFINDVETISRLSDLDTLFNTNLFKIRTGLNSLGSSWGGGFDVGADVKITKNFGVKASLMDMGWLKWNRNQDGAVSYKVEINPNHHLYQNGELVFAGMPFESIDFSDDLFTQFFDYIAIDSAFLFTKTTTKDYVMATNPKLFLEGYYQLKCHIFSALLRLNFIEKRTLPSFTLGYNFELKKVIDIALSYTMAKGSYGNFGVGVSLHFGDVFNFYLATDHLIGAFFPLANNSLNVQTGIYFTIPAKKAKKTAESEKQ